MGSARSALDSNQSRVGSHHHCLSTESGGLSSSGGAYVDASGYGDDAYGHDGDGVRGAVFDDASHSAAFCSRHASLDASVCS